MGFDPSLWHDIAMQHWCSFERMERHRMNRKGPAFLFFPSLGMAAATLVLLAFWEDDVYALDVKLAGT
jgi:hypothetical protein